MRKRSAPRNVGRGFTLIEVAIAFLVIGLLFSGGLFVATTVFQTDRTRKAERTMDKIERALVEFAAIQGRLPCPTRLGTAPEGREHRDGDGSCLGDQANGVVPWLSIGLSRDEVLDPWNRYVTYRVDDHTAVGVTRNNGIDMTQCYPGADENLDNGTPVPVNNCTALTADPEDWDRPENFLQEKGVRVTDDGANLLADPMAGSGAAFVLISHGANGYYGIENPDILIPPGPDAHTLEANNAVNQPFDPDNDLLAQAAPGAFDDIVRWRTILWVAQAAGRGPGTPAPGTEDEQDETELMAQLDISDEAINKVFAGTHDNPWGPRRIAAPQITSGQGADDNSLQFQNTTSTPHDQASCWWSRPDIRLRDSVIRAYFEASFRTETDPPSRRYGMVKTFMPFEIGATSANWQEVSERCGEEGEGLGFNSVIGTGQRRLIDPDDFTPSLTNYRHGMAFGLELDVWHIAGEPFREPSNQADHAAVNIHNVYHCPDPRAGAQCGGGGPFNDNFIYANPSCRNAPGETCRYPTSGTLDWLQRGHDNRHKVRVELERGAGACAANEIRARWWVWPHDQDCAGNCTNLEVNYTTNDAGAYQLTRCLPASPRTVNMGFGSTLNAFDKVRSGFTAGLPGNPNNAAQATVYKFGIGSYPTYPARTNAPGNAVSAELRARTIAPNLNWTVIQNAGGRQDQGWTRTTWLDLPDLDAEVMSWKGEIAVLDDYWRGWGVRGIGGDPGVWDYAPMLDNVQNPDNIKPPGERERLTFTFDRYYQRAVMHLTLFNVVNGTPERLRVRLFRASDPDNERTVIVDSCVAGGSGTAQTAMLADITVTGDGFDAVAVEPEPRSDGQPSSAYIRNIRLCGATAGGACAPTVDPANDPIPACTTSATVN